MTLEELRAYVLNEYPEYIHTFDWDECPEDWDDVCFCVLCRSYMD